MKIYNDLNMDNNQITNAIYEKLATPPENAVEGQYYYNTIDKKLYYYDGTEWVTSETNIKTMSTQSTNLTCTLPDDL